MLVFALVVLFGIVSLTLYIAQNCKGWLRILLSKIQVLVAMRRVKAGMSPWAPPSRADCVLQPCHRTQGMPSMWLALFTTRCRTSALGSRGRCSSLSETTCFVNKMLIKLFVY